MSSDVQLSLSRIVPSRQRENNSRSFDEKPGQYIAFTVKWLIQIEIIEIVLIGNDLIKIIIYVGPATSSKQVP